MIKIQFNPFIPKIGVSNMGGLIIPSATSIAVTMDKKMSTPHIFCWLDLKVKSPRKIDSLCAILYQIKEGENKYPNKVDKVPIQAYFFNHFVMAATLVGTQQYIKENNTINNHTWQDVETMESSYKEEKVSK